MSIPEIEKAKKLIENNSDHIELLLQENIKTESEMDRVAQSQAIRAHTLSIRISSELLDIISMHDKKINDIELVIGPIRDAQTTSKTISSWSNAYPWVFAFLFGGASWMYHFVEITAK